MASSEALDVVHWAMRLASYRCISMAIKIAIDSPAVFVAVDPLSPTTIAKYHAKITATSGPVIAVSLHRIVARGARNET